MFEVDSEGNAIRLAALPQEKFFNLYENPSTMDLDLNEVESIEVKCDGSLISTYFHDGQLRLKSKGSLSSDQALDAVSWLDAHENKAYRKQLYWATVDGCTVNLEWVSPNNRIVLGYEKPHLIMLNMRDNFTGKTFYFGEEDEPISHWIAIKDVIYNPPIDLQGKSPIDFVADIPNMTGVEGFVVRFKSGLKVKVKTNWYLALHHTKDSINNPRRLFEAVLDEGIDDLRALFHEDLVAIKQIDEMEIKVDRLFNHMVKSVEDFYEENKHLDRKDYAIKGQTNVLDKRYFGLVMLKYQNKDPEYKNYLKSKWKLFGFKDEKVDIE